MVLDRRNILKFIAGGAAGALLTPAPYKLADDLALWTQNWPWVPSPQQGTKDAASAIVKLGGPEYGIVVNTVDGRPITAQGNTEHPLSLGGIDPLAAASVQLLHSPARIKGPLRRDSSGKFTSITWQEAARILKERLSQAAEKKDQIACISGDETGSSTEVWSAFLQALNSESLYFLPSDRGVQTRVWNQMMGGAGCLGLDIEQSDLILALGPDVLGSWGSAIKNQRIFGTRQPELHYAGPTQNATAAVATSWVPVAAPNLGHMALAIAYHLLADVRVPAGLHGFASFSSFVRQEYSPRKATQKTGLGPDTVRKLAHRVLRAQNPLIIPGSPTGRGASGFTHWAGLGLNCILDRINAPGGLPALPPPPSVVSSGPQWSHIRAKDLVASMQAAVTWKQNPPQLLFCFEANPAYSLPNTKLTADFLDMTEFTVSMSQFMDETAARSDLVLPPPYFLERQDDCYTPYGSSQAIYSISPEIVSPQTDSQSIPDFLVQLASQMGISLPLDSFQDLLKSKAAALNANWRSLRKGKSTWTSQQLASKQSPGLWSQDIETMALAAQEAASPSGLILATVQDLKTGTARSGIPPFGLQALRDDELLKEDIPARMSRTTAGRLGVHQGDVVRITSEQGHISRARIQLDEGVMPLHVALPLGFGHTNWDQFNRNKGTNAQALYTVRLEAGSGVCTWCGSEVDIEITASARS